MVALAGRGAEPREENFGLFLHRSQRGQRDDTAAGRCNDQRTAERRLALGAAAPRVHRLAVATAAAAGLTRARIALPRGVALQNARTMHFERDPD